MSSELIAAAIEQIQRRTDAAEKIRCGAARFAYSSGCTGGIAAAEAGATAAAAA